MASIDPTTVYRIRTADGSDTLCLPSGQSYHSINGAIQESIFVYIRNGLLPLFEQKKEIRILELGLGTGLNCILSYCYSEYYNVRIEYTGVDAYPINLQMAKELYYERQVRFKNFEEIFRKIHLAEEYRDFMFLGKHFSFRKLKQRFEHIDLSEQYDLIYHDAFGPGFEMRYWQAAFLKKLYSLLRKNGRLITYCAMGQFKRDLRGCGFEVLSPEGPPGKREITLAIRK